MALRTTTSLSILEYCNDLRHLTMDRRTPTDFESLADAAAHKAVLHTFAMLGIDLSRQEEINALRDVLLHARKMQKLSERAGFIGIMVLTTAVVSGALAFLWTGFLESIRR